MDSLCAESEKFRARNRELERQLEDLLVELNKVHKQAKASDNKFYDLEDEIDKTKHVLFWLLSDSNILI